MSDEFSLMVLMIKSLKGHWYEVTVTEKNDVTRLEIQGRPKSALSALLNCISKYKKERWTYENRHTDITTDRI